MNEIIRQENTSSDNQAIGENRNETVSSFGENEYTDEELEIAERLSKVLENAEKSRLPALRSVNKSVLKREVQKMNLLLAKIRSENITTTNDLIYAAAVVTTENVGIKIKKGSKQAEPMWKRRIENQIRLLRKDLSSIEELKKGRKIKARYKEELQRKYWLKERGLIIVSEELKQRINGEGSEGIKIKGKNRTVSAEKPIQE